MKGTTSMSSLCGGREGRRKGGMGLEGDEFRGVGGRDEDMMGDELQVMGSVSVIQEGQDSGGTLLCYPTALPTCKCCGGLSLITQCCEGST